MRTETLICVTHKQHTHNRKDTSACCVDLDTHRLRDKEASVFFQSDFRHTNTHTETFTQDVVIGPLSSLSCCIICTRGGESKWPAAVCASQAELLVLKKVFSK